MAVVGQENKRKQDPQLESIREETSMNEQAFLKELPQLLEEYPDQFVIYAHGQRVKIGPKKFKLISEVSQEIDPRYIWCQQITEFGLELNKLSFKEEPLAFMSSDLD